MALLSSNVGLEHYDGSRSQKSQPQNFEKSRRKISHFRPHKSAKIPAKSCWENHSGLLTPSPLSLWTVALWPALQSTVHQNSQTQEQSPPPPYPIWTTHNTPQYYTSVHTSTNLLRYLVHMHIHNFVWTFSLFLWFQNVYCIFSLILCFITLTLCMFALCLYFLYRKLPPRQIPRQIHCVYEHTWK